jgi:hypothetical protein
VGDTVGIPFRKVKVLKAVQSWSNPVADALAYSMKATGTYSLRSSISANGELEERFIAPPDFLPRLADRAGSVVYGVKADIASICDAQADGCSIISTIPMPALMDLLGYDGPRPAFAYQDGAVLTATIESCDAYATVYLPNPILRYYRVSVTGSRLIVEYSGNNLAFDELDAPMAVGWLGIDGFRAGGCLSDIQFKPQRYAKIVAIDENLRKRFLSWASQEHGVYSLGRFATWRPGLLLDDIVNDVRVIQRLAETDHAYDYRKDNQS